MLFIKISSNGILSFKELISADPLEQPSGIPFMATLWTLAASQQNATLYSRVAQDNSTLELIKENLMEEYFKPLLAVVVTWKSNLSVSAYFHNQNAAVLKILNSYIAGCV